MPFTPCDWAYMRQHAYPRPSALFLLFRLFSRPREGMPPMPPRKFKGSKRRLDPAILPLHSPRQRSAHDRTAQRQRLFPRAGWNVAIHTGDQHVVFDPQMNMSLPAKPLHGLNRRRNDNWVLSTGYRDLRTTDTHQPQMLRPHAQGDRLAGIGARRRGNDRESTGRRLGKP